MSSPPKEKAETRAGHPPAVKAGGMRIVQKHPTKFRCQRRKDKDDQDWETSSPTKSAVFISGVIARVRLSLRWLIRNHILLWKSFLTRSTSNSTSTSLANELPVRITANLLSVNVFRRRQKPFSIHTVKSVKLTSKIIHCFFYFNSEGLIRMKTLFSCYPRWKILY
uniref:Death associated protein n=1 Tax=Taeniopygia guttata TaxID=59729 RepID=A0A674H058_TAEGU